MGVPDLHSQNPVIVCMGEILIDLFPAELGKKMAEVSAFHPKPGGAPANVAVAAHRLGTPSAFIGKVGEDAFGAHLIDVLREQGVETRGMRVDPQARTTLAFIAKPDANTSEYVFYRNPGADLMISPAELDRPLLTGARAFHFGSLSMVAEPARSATREAVRLAHAAGALVSFDVNFRPSLWASPAQALEQIRAMIPLADLLKVNEVEIELLAGQNDDLPAACADLLAQGPRLIAATLGARGSFYCTAGVHGAVAPFPVDPVDATGCGDAFAGALLTRLVSAADWRTQLTAESLERAFRFANATGALTALTQGVIPALPTRVQVEKFLANF
jgi:fructokinase